MTLSPGSRTSAGDCPSASPDATCSATVVPDGTKVGFAEVDDLPAGPVQVGATATIAGQQRHFETITVNSAATYPNGRQCGAGGNQASVEVRLSGLAGR